MIYKMTSSKAVIAKVIADLGLNDIKQWIGESLMNIGSVNQLDHKVEVIPINGYQAKLPCDLERLNSVAYSTCDCGGWIPMKKSTGTFSVYDKKDKITKIFSKAEDAAKEVVKLIYDAKIL